MSFEEGYASPCYTQCVLVENTEFKVKLKGTFKQWH